MHLTPKDRDRGPILFAKLCAKLSQLNKSQRKINLRGQTIFASCQSAPPFSKPSKSLRLHGESKSYYFTENMFNYL